MNRHATSQEAHQTAQRAANTYGEPFAYYRAPDNAAELCVVPKRWLPRPVPLGTVIVMPVKPKSGN